MSSIREHERVWEELEDRDLVQMAQAGEREAFGELVRRHRSKMYGYARTVTHESFLAEDIVQEALVRAFLHLGKLADVERFLPWVHRIVRNQAFTKLNQSSITKERTFSELESTLPIHEADTPDWGDLDAILRRLNRSAAGDAAVGYSPEDRFMRKETLRVLTEIIACLKPRERRIFESHFFDQLSPQEIAKLFQLSTANVYQVLSRTRKKVVQEKIRVTVDHYIKTRKDMGNMNKVILPNSETFGEVRTWTTVADSLYSMLKYTDKGLSFPMIMGLTGHAFRINIIPDSVHIAGPTAYNFEEILVRGLRNIGLTAKAVDGLKPTIGENANFIDPSLLEKEAMAKRESHRSLPEALDLIHRSIDRGIPVLAWDIFFPEFGVLYGYDDEQRQLYADECGRRDTLPYEHLGRGVLEEIFVLGIEDAFEVSRQDQLREALRMIGEHYEGEESRTPSEAVKGLAAYDAWIDALQGGQIEPNGHAYNIAVILDGRKYAAKFWQELGVEWPQASETDRAIRSLIGNATELYEGIAESLALLHGMFPYPEGGEPNNETKSREAIEILQTIKKQETAAVEVLRKMLIQLG